MLLLSKAFFQLPFLFYDTTFSFNHQYIIYITYNISYIIYYYIYRPSHVRWSSLIDTYTYHPYRGIPSYYQCLPTHIPRYHTNHCLQFTTFPFLHTCQCNLIHPRGYLLAKAMPAKLLGIFRVLPPCPPLLPFPRMSNCHLCILYTRSRADSKTNHVLYFSSCVWVNSIH